MNTINGNEILQILEVQKSNENLHCSTAAAFCATRVQLLMERNATSMERRLQVNLPSVGLRNTNVKEKHLEPLQSGCCKARWPRSSLQDCEFYLFVYLRHPSLLQYFPWPVTSGLNKVCDRGPPCPHNAPHRGNGPRLFEGPRVATLQRGVPVKQRAVDYLQFLFTMGCVFQVEGFIMTWFQLSVKLFASIKMKKRTKVLKFVHMLSLVLMHFARFLLIHWISFQTDQKVVAHANTQRPPNENNANSQGCFGLETLGLTYSAMFLKKRDL